MITQDINFTLHTQSQVNILLVDDRTENLIALEAILGKLSQNLVRAYSGKQALKYLLEQDFAVVILDVSMPEMDGFETAQLIRQRQRSQHTPIIFLSAVCDNQLMSERGYTLGAVDCLSKPFDPTILAAKVAVFVDLSKKNLEIQQQATQLVAQKLENFRIQSARQQAEQSNRMKEEFISVVSHELRTPLNAILGWSQLLLEGKLKPEKAQQALQTIARNAKAQTQLIDDILDITRLNQGKVQLVHQPLNFIHLLQAVLESLRPQLEQKSICLQSELDPAGQSITGDRGRLRQILWNLLANAIKFTPTGGQIDLRLAKVADQTSPTKAYTQISITDTGIGISPEFLPYVFDRFRQADGSITRSHGGLGLGLAIVRQLVELHQGKIEVASQGKDRGTTFTVYLPLDPTPPPQPVEPVHSSESTDAIPSLAGIRVLVVEDHSDSRAMIQSLLETAGATAIATASVSEALEYFQENSVDVLISDIAMPDADGYDLIHKIRALESERGGHLPAIALSAYAKSADRSASLQAGFELHLAKPVEAHTLIAAVARLRNPEMPMSQTDLA